MGNAAKKIDSEFFSESDIQNEVQSLKERLAVLESQKSNDLAQEDRLSIVVFSGSLDKLIASFVIANGAAASGMSVTLFFTFWGTSAFKRLTTKPIQKSFLERMFGWMLPKGSVELPLSQMNMFGIGPKMIRHMMKIKNVESIESMIQLAGDLGVEVRICEMSMELMGIHRSEIRDYPNLDYCGVASFVETATKGKTTLFI